MTTRHNGTGLITTADTALTGGPGRRPRGAGRALAADPESEARCDPRLELAEQLLHQVLDPNIGYRRDLLQQVHNLLEDAGEDLPRPRVVLVPGPRADVTALPGLRDTADLTGPAVPALLRLDRLLLALTEGVTTHRARRIMEARQLLHHVRQEWTRTRTSDEPRSRLLAEILNTLEHRSTDTGM